MYHLREDTAEQQRRGKQGGSLLVRVEKPRCEPQFLSVGEVLHKVLHV